MVDESKDVEAVTGKGTPFQLLGGEAAVRCIAEHFYDVMRDDPAALDIRLMHGEDLGPIREKLGDWMVGALGGPPLYARRPDRGCMVSVHKALPIGEKERDQWMYCLRAAFERAGVSEDLREMLDGPFLQLADQLRSR